MNLKLLLISLLFIMANVLAWFQVNSQYIWGWWKEHPVTTVLIYAVPTSMCFFFGWRTAVDYFGHLWSARMFAFGLSTMVFYTLTYCILKEGLDTKNLVCLGLSFVIILIQVLWK
jgi:hypothetical protein